MVTVAGKIETVCRSKRTYYVSLHILQLISWPFFQEALTTQSLFIATSRIYDNVQRHTVIAVNLFASWLHDTRHIIIQCRLFAVINCTWKKKYLNSVNMVLYNRKHSTMYLDWVMLYLKDCQKAEFHSESIFTPSFDLQSNYSRLSVNLLSVFRNKFESQFCVTDKNTHPISE